MTPNWKLLWLAITTRHLWPSVTGLAHRDRLHLLAAQLCHERRTHKGRLVCRRICRQCEREAAQVDRNMQLARSQRAKIAA